MYPIHQIHQERVVTDRQHLNEFSQKYKVAVDVHTAQTSESVPHEPTWNGFMTVQHPGFNQVFRCILKSFSGTRKMAEEEIIKNFLNRYSITQMAQMLCVPESKPWNTLAGGIPVHKIMDTNSKLPYKFGNSSPFLFVDIEGFDTSKGTFQVLTIFDKSDVLYVHPDAITLVTQLLEQKVVVLFDSRLDIKMLKNVNVKLGHVVDIQKHTKKSIGGRYWGLKSLTRWISKVEFSELPLFKKNLEWWTDKKLEQYAVADVVALRLCFEYLSLHKHSSIM